MPSVDAIGELSPYAVTDSAELIFEGTVKPVTIYYVDETGNAITPLTTINGALGENYSTSPLIISGYEIDTVVGEPSGQFSYRPVSITYVYKASEETVLPPDEGVAGEDGNGNGEKGNEGDVTLNSPEWSSIASLAQTNSAATTAVSFTGLALLFTSILLLNRRRKIE